MMNLGADKAQNLLLFNALRFHKAQVLLDQSDALVVSDAVSGIVFARFTAERAIPSIQKAIPETTKTLALIGPVTTALADYYHQRFANLRETIQLVYEKKEPIPTAIPEGIRFRQATLDDIPFISAHYRRTGDDYQYLQESITQRGMLVAERGGKPVGFIGEHPELAIGLLFVLETERRHGIGKALLQEEINSLVKKGEHEPLEHIEIHNEASLRLHREVAAFTYCPLHVWWFF